MKFVLFTGAALTLDSVCLLKVGLLWCRYVTLRQLAAWMGIVSATSPRLESTAAPAVISVPSLTWVRTKTARCTMTFELHARGVEQRLVAVYQWQTLASVPGLARPWSGIKVCACQVITIIIPSVFRLISTACSFAFGKRFSRYS